MDVIALFISWANY